MLTSPYSNPRNASISARPVVGYSFLHNRFVHNRAGAESFSHSRFVHNRAGAESFLYDRFVHNRTGAESFLHNRFVHNQADAQSFLHNWYVHNPGESFGLKFIPNQSDWFRNLFPRQSELIRVNPKKVFNLVWSNSVKNQSVSIRVNPRLWIRVNPDQSFNPHESEVGILRIDSD